MVPPNSSLDQISPARTLVIVWAAAMPYVLYGHLNGLDEARGLEDSRAQILVLTGMKTLPALLCAWRSCPNHRWNVVGFLFCALGDALLQMDSRAGFPPLFVAGLASFLIGHIAFIVTFWSLGGKQFEVDATLLTMVLAFLIVAFLWDGIGENDDILYIALPAYAFTIATMCNRAVSLSRLNGSHTAAEKLAGKCVVLGAGIFMLSDTLIAVDKFKLDLGSWRNVYIQVTYFSAIALISLSGHISIPEEGTNNEKKRR